MGPLGKLSISRVEKPRLGCGIYISPYVAHSWVQTGTGANMQKRQYLHSSRLCLGSQEGLGLFQSQQTKRGGGGADARGCQAGRQEPGRTEANGMAGETQSSSNHRLQGWGEHSPPNRRLGTQRSLEWEIPPRAPFNWPHFIDGKTEAQTEDRIF